MCGVETSLCISGLIIEFLFVIRQSREFTQSAQERNNMSCENCSRECDMIRPTRENPEKRFQCPKCNSTYIEVEIITDDDIREN